MRARTAKMRHDHGDTYLTINEAAALLGVSAATLRRWDANGRLRAKRNPITEYRLYTRSQLLQSANALGLEDLGNRLDADCSKATSGTPSAIAGAVVLNDNDAARFVRSLTELVASHDERNVNRNDTKRSTSPLLTRIVKALLAPEADEEAAVRLLDAVADWLCQRGLLVGSSVLMDMATLVSCAEVLATDGAHTALRKAARYVEQWAYPAWPRARSRRQALETAKGFIMAGYPILVVGLERRAAAKKLANMFLAEVLLEPTIAELAPKIDRTAVLSVRGEKTDDVVMRLRAFALDSDVEAIVARAFRRVLPLQLPEDLSADTAETLIRRGLAALGCQRATVRNLFSD